MKYLLFILIIPFIFSSCGTSKNKIEASDAPKNLEEAVIISNDSLEYEIIIYDPGFSLYLNTIAKPDWYYEQNYLEVKNKYYVIEWNIRHLNPLRYGSFYETHIDYSPFIDYGLEVNYKLYNYFQFVEHKYKIRF